MEKDKGRYVRFTCAACATVATFAALHLVFLESRDVVIGADHSQLHLEQHWLGPETDQLPPRFTYPWAAINHWFAPTTEYPVQRAPMVLLGAGLGRFITTSGA